MIAGTIGGAEARKAASRIDFARGAA
jgi:hypothetical protein